MRFLILLISVTSLFSFSFFYSKGEFSYSVWNNSVKANLNFPFSYYGVSLKLTKNNYFLNVKTKINSLDKNGEDKDFLISSGKIISYSKNKTILTNYFETTIGYEKFFIFNLGVQKYRFDWENSLYSNGVILRYNVDGYYFGFGVKKQFKNNFTIKLAVNPIYYKIKDEHILRNFYVTQQFWTIRYLAKLAYNVNKSFQIYTSYEKANKNNTDMNFYNNSGKYLTLDSSFKYHNFTFGINYYF